MSILYDFIYVMFKNSQTQSMVREVSEWFPLGEGDTGSLPGRLEVFYVLSVCTYIKRHEMYIKYSFYCT